jgi:CTP synthase
MQVLELPSTRPADEDESPRGPKPTHPYFIGAQYHPELTSRPLRPQPLFMGLVAAAIRHAAQSDADALAAIDRDTDLSRWLHATPRNATAQ